MTNTVKSTHALDQIEWDGHDIEVFFEILNAVLDGQKIAVRLSGGRREVISTPDEIDNILPPESPERLWGKRSIPEELKNVIIEKTVPSDDMKQYFSNKQFSPEEAAELVFKSAASLQTKADLIGKLASHEDLWRSLRDEMVFWDSRLIDAGENRRLTYKQIVEDSLHGLYQSVNGALQNLNLEKGEIFYLSEAWYDAYYDDNVHETGITAVMNYEAAQNAVHREYAYNKWNDQTDVWMILDKYVPGKDGIMNHTYRYYMIYDEVVYYEKQSPLWKTPKKHDYSPIYGKGDGGFLEQLLPFPVGTIVSVSSFPFSPQKKPGVLIENFDEFVEVLLRDEKGNWKIVNLAHGMEWGMYRPMLSALYQIQKYNKPLGPKEQILAKVSQLISGDEERGHQFYDLFYEFAESADEKMYIKPSGGGKSHK